MAGYCSSGDETLCFKQGIYPESGRIKIYCFADYGWVLVGIKQNYL